MYHEVMMVSRSVSRLERLTRMYYDRELEDCGIGWGQQYFLLFIQHHPGVMPQELTDAMHVDKGTTTKALKKLCQMGYLETVSDEKDRRIKHLYATKAALPVAEKIRGLHDHLHGVMLQGFSQAEMLGFEQGLDKLVQNILGCLSNEKEKGGDT